METSKTKKIVIVTGPKGNQVMKMHKWLNSQNIDHLVLFDKRKIYMGDGHYEYFIRGMEEHEQFISVVGHTVTDNRRIWVSPSGRTIRIDCGAGYKCYGKEGTLGAIRLNDMKEFYIN